VPAVFSRSQRYYDAIYSGKDYAQEAAHVKRLIAEHKRSDGNTLLDVACGTGGHVPYLGDDFAYEGLDLDPEMLALARWRFPDVTFYHGDMVDFALGRQFDEKAPARPVLSSRGTGAPPARGFRLQRTGEECAQCTDEFAPRCWTQAGRGQTECGA
jgi:SAM-dependent methyltransferase